MADVLASLEGALQRQAQEPRGSAGQVRQEEPRGSAGGAGAAALEEGEIWEVAAYAAHFDGYLRGQDPEMMQSPNDIEEAEDEVSIMMGDPERGERAKVGVDQDVLLDRSWVWGRVFRHAQTTYRRRFKKRLRQRNIPDDDGPHRLRHSGAANDVRRKERSTTTPGRRSRR